MTLSIAILISMVLSFTTTPMLCSRILKPAYQGRHGYLYRISEKAFNGLLKLYEVSLDWVLGHHAGAVLLLLLITMALNVVNIIKIPKGFFPQQDTGVVMGGLMGPQDASFQKMNGVLRRAVTIVKSDPGVLNVVGFTGG